MKTKLYELHESEFQAGGEIDRLARAAGYASGRAFANENGQWNSTVDEVVKRLKQDVIDQKKAEVDSLAHGEYEN